VKTEAGAGVKAEASRGYAAAVLLRQALDTYLKVPHVLVLDRGHHIVHVAEAFHQIGWKRRIFSLSATSLTFLDKILFAVFTKLSSQ